LPVPDYVFAISNAWHSPQYYPGDWLSLQGAGGWGGTPARKIAGAAQFRHWRGSAYWQYLSVMTANLPNMSVATELAERVATLTSARLPPAVRQKCEDLLVDVVGLCVTARNEDYIKRALNGWDDDGVCTAIGHARTLNAAGAAFINGTAAHGEDFDDTFEGGPVHAGAVVVPAVLAACERHRPDGPAALLGIAVGVEVLCRLSLVVPVS
jgi:hypothetical protein